MRSPPAADQELFRSVLGEASQLRSLRAALQQAVIGQDLAERVTLAATELASNALRHGRPPAVVTLQRSDGHLVVDVLDNDPGSAPDVDERRPAGAGGLGLVLIERLAQQVGWYGTAAGKGVWATFALDDPGESNGHPEVSTSSSPVTCKIR
jgi:anti-sigma regulatory factor (Ser/Thr protein kinase)